ncbi:MAG TPA: response regulator [Xanthobacteraceae bacterium]|nr:response regulator [Xanthobacteraceae bacterium]
MKPEKSAVHLISPGRQLAPAHPRPRVVFAHDETSRSDTRTEKPARILIVEDDFLVAMQMESALADAGFEIAGVASSGEDAIELAMSERPRLAVMDIRLAGDRDGIDTALTLFAEQGIRCVFATAHHDEHARRRAEPAAPLGWLAKPYTMGSLVTMVRRALDELGDPPCPAG